METKVCTKCNTEKSIEEYYQIKKTNYIYNYCKKCHYKATKPIAKKWRAKNPDRWKQDVRVARQAMFDRQREGVYLLVTTKGLYVGQTDKYDNRIQQHTNSNFKGNALYKGAEVLHSTLLEEIHDRDQRMEREKFWIKTLKPELNKVHNPDYIRTTRGGKYIKK